MWRLSLAVASGATLHRGARASHYRGLSCCGAQAPDAQAQQLWLTGQVAPRHVGSSQTRARTRVPCTGRQTLNHCTTREAPIKGFIILQNALLSSTAISSPHYNNWWFLSLLYFPPCKFYNFYQESTIDIPFWWDERQAWSWNVLPYSTIKKILTKMSPPCPWKIKTHGKGYSVKSHCTWDFFHTLVRMDKGKLEAKYGADIN